MKTGILFFVILFSFSLVVAQVNECYNCHISEVEDQPSQVFKQGVHYQAGLTCADCHGGDPTSDDMDIAMDPDRGFIGVPEGDDIINVCLKCHADAARMQEFYSTINVEQFKEFKNSAHGKSEIATCITCHGVHNIKRKTDRSSPVYPTREIQLCAKCHSDASYMKRFNPGLPTDQLDKYKTSIHGKRILQGDTKVATCSDCHSAHDIFSAKDPRSSTYPTRLPKTCANCHSNADYMKEYGIPTDQYEKFARSVHGIALLEKGDTGAPACNDCHGNHGAVPPGVQSISHVCGVCHALNAEYFAKSPHAPAFEEAGLPQCESCHGNHLIEKPTDDMLGKGEKSVCLECHSEEEKAIVIGEEMRAKLDSLVQKSNLAEKLLEMAEVKGMDVSDARFKLKDINQILIKSRTVTHQLEIAEFDSTITPGYKTIEEIIQAGQAALKEYDVRRYGLGVSTLFITLLVIALYLKIRRIEKEQQAAS